MMPTLDDRNKPIDPFSTRKSIDECSGEEWNAATKRHWDWIKETKVYEEDPVYSQDEPEEKLFSGSLFDDADDDRGDTESIYQMIEEEDAFENIVKIMGPWEAISFCHGTALAILMDKDNFTNSASIEKAKVYLSRMARLINETKECNW